MAVERGSERFRYELATLIRIEDLRHAVDRNGFFKSRDTESRIKRILNLPRQYLPRIDADDRHQVHMSSCKLDVSDVCSPDLIRQPYVLARQEVRILPVLLRWHARPLACVSGTQTCPFHDAADLFAHHAHVSQLPSYLAVTIKWTDPQYFKDGLKDRYFPFIVGFP